MVATPGQSFKTYVYLGIRLTSNCSTYELYHDTLFVRHYTNRLLIQSFILLIPSDSHSFIRSIYFRPLTRPNRLTIFKRLDDLTTATMLHRSSMDAYRPASIDTSYRPSVMDPYRPKSSMGLHYPVTLTPPIYADDRPFFAHMGHEIPRPSSAAPLYTAPHYSVPQRSFSGPMQLPGVSSLGPFGGNSMSMMPR